jgi:hypothetical protein
VVPLMCEHEGSRVRRLDFVPSVASFPLHGPVLLHVFSSDAEGTRCTAGSCRVYVGLRSRVFLSEEEPFEASQPVIAPAAADGFACWPADRMDREARAKELLARVDVSGCARTVAEGNANWPAAPLEMPTSSFGTAWARRPLGKPAGKPGADRNLSREVRVPPGLQLARTRHALLACPSPLLCLAAAGKHHGPSVRRRAQQLCETRC